MSISFVRPVSSGFGFRRMTRFPSRLLLPLVVLLLNGCATTQEYDPPTINVTSLRIMPSGTMSPRFMIELQIVNPNRTALELEGIAYTLYLEEHKILNGVSNELPAIEAYGEGEVTLYATTNLMGSISLINDLMRRPRDEYQYRLDAKLDPGANKSELRIVDEGTIKLGS